jgi:peptidyl-prolyl cis-trans isomerase D
MFDFVRNNTRILQLILLILILPSFVIFGIQGYDKFLTEDDVVAKVGGQKVSMAEMDNAHRRMVEQARARNPQLDVSKLDSPEVKRQALDSLVEDYTLIAAVNDQRIRTADSRILRLFATSPDFASLRNPDGTLNTKLLEAQGMTSAQLTERIRQQLTMMQVTSGVVGTGMASDTVNKLAVDALFQVRDVQWLPFEAKAYVAQLNPTEEQLRKFFAEPGMNDVFTQPEKADIEYLVLDLDSLKSRAVVSEEELRKSYQDNIGKYARAEERRASHILIKADSSAAPEARKAAKAKAESLLAQVRKNPASFAEMARKNSEDEGSAANGGDLDFFGRGAMVKPFEDATFALKKGEISGLVESDFGYHIIQLTDVRGGDTLTFEQVRAEIEADARKQLAQRMYAEVAEKFTNAVYEQSDSLKAVAEELKLPLQTAQGVLAKPTSDQGVILGNQRLLQALFDPANRAKGRNTDAIEVSANKLVSARIAKYYPPAKPAFETVQADVKARWMAAESVKAAKADAEAKMAAWQKDPAQSKLPASVQMSRRLMFSQPSQVLEAALRVPEKSLPAWKVVDLGAQGAALIKVNKVLPTTMSADERLETRQQLAGYLARAETMAYMEALKRELKVKYTPKAPAKASDAEKSASK